MNLYKITCYSECGTYFASYLQSVTVAAESAEQAELLAKEWMSKEGRSFIKANEWGYELLATDLGPGVLDYHEDSDY